MDKIDLLIDNVKDLKGDFKTLRRDNTKEHQKLVESIYGLKTKVAAIVIVLYFILSNSKTLLASIGNIFRG